MSLFKNLFGKSDPMVELGKLHARGEWAALLTAARRLERADLAANVQAQVAAWETEAGNSLAEVNLAEGAGALRLGNLLKAREHLELAAAQAQRPELRERAAQLLAGLAGGNPVAAAVQGTAAASCGSSCGPSCAPGMAVTDEEAELDAAGRLELLLATLHHELAERYAAAGEA